MILLLHTVHGTLTDPDINIKYLLASKNHIFSQSKSNFVVELQLLQVVLLTSDHVMAGRTFNM